MIKIENVEVQGWESAIRGCRNPKNSWDRMDSYQDTTCYRIGPNDHDLMMRLAKAGPEHAKYRRMIVVWLDVTAPIYLWGEIDTYKIGTVRNSCSFMHKGISEPFSIYDFSIKDDRVYDVLSPLKTKEHTLSYPYETDEYKEFISDAGRKYRVYRNGRIVREAFEYVDSYGTGRRRFFPESNATTYRTRNGYYVVKFSGRNQGRIMLHRMVAEMWCEKPEGATQVNHIDGDKGNNCAENLEWVTQTVNIKKANETGLYSNTNSLHARYMRWKNSSIVISPRDRMSFYLDSLNGQTCSELAIKYNISKEQANNSRWIMNNSEYEELFQECFVWETVINQLNSMRDTYAITKDPAIFQAIRCLIPQGYLQKATLMLNYEALANIYRQRKNHKLDEWRAFCRWIESLPYSEIITLKERSGHVSEEEKHQEQNDSVS